MRVLVGCEFSGIVRDAFRRQGHEAFSCDLIPCLPSIYSQFHLVGDVRKFVQYGWDLLIAHPDCTYLTNAGVRHLYGDAKSRKGKQALVFGKARWDEMEKAAEFFNELQDLDIDRICIENPIPHRYARERVGDYTQIIQPWQFGHGEIKGTCLWLRNLPELRPTDMVEGREPRVLRESRGIKNGLTRKQRRSITYKGIAEAMSSQWGGLI